MLTEPEPEAAADTSVCMPVGGGGGAEKPTGSVEKKPKKNRCVECRKKVGLTGFECKCGGLYCGMHRMASSHACTFDHAGRNKELLEKRVQSVIADKVEKVPHLPPSLPPSLSLCATEQSRARLCRSEAWVTSRCGVWRRGRRRSILAAPARQRMATTHGGTLTRHRKVERGTGAALRDPASAGM